jgi:hypothetical protein
MLSVLNIAIVFATEEDPTDPEPQTVTEAPQTHTEKPTVKPTEKPTETTKKPKPTKTTEATTKKPAKTTGTTKAATTSAPKTTKAPATAAPTQQPATKASSGDVNKYKYEEVEIGYYDEDDYEFVPSNEDYVIDLTQGESLSKEMGFYGPTVSNEEALDMNSEGMTFDTSVKDAYASIDFASTKIEDYQYALIKIKSSDATMPSNFSLKIGNVEKAFNEWTLTNDSNPPSALSQDFKVYAIDLKQNGVTQLICKEKSDDEDHVDEPDINFVNTMASKPKITVSYLIFTNEKPTYTKVVPTEETKREKIIGKIIIPIILIIISIAVLYYVNFVVYKKQKMDDKKVKRTQTNYDEGYIRRK